MEFKKAISEVIVSSTDLQFDDEPLVDIQLEPVDDRVKAMGLMPVSDLQPEACEQALEEIVTELERTGGSPIFTHVRLLPDADGNRIRVELVGHPIGSLSRLAVGMLTRDSRAPMVHRLVMQRTGAGGLAIFLGISNPGA